MGPVARFLAVEQARETGVLPDPALLALGFGGATRRPKLKASSPGLAAMICVGLFLIFVFPQFRMALWLTWLGILAGLAAVALAGKAYPKRWVRVATLPFRVLGWLLLVIPFMVLGALAGYRQGARRSRGRQYGF
jgi:hypothetical protein